MIDISKHQKWYMYIYFMRFFPRVMKPFRLLLPVLSFEKILIINVGETSRVVCVVTVVHLNSITVQHPHSILDYRYHWIELSQSIAVYLFWLDAIVTFLCNRSTRHMKM